MDEPSFSGQHRPKRTAASKQQIIESGDSNFTADEDDVYRLKYTYHRKIRMQNQRMTMTAWHLKLMYPLIRTLVQ